MHAPAKGTINDPSWRAFAAWCRRLALCPLPAHPWTVGAFLRWCEEKPGAVAVAEAVVAIAAVHTRRGYERPERHAIVRRTLAALARQRGDVAEAGAGTLIGVTRPRARVTSAKPRPQKRALAGMARTARVRVSAGTMRTFSPAPKLVARRQYRTAH